MGELIDWVPLLTEFKQQGLSRWAEQVRTQCQKRQHGDWLRWFYIWQGLPAIKTAHQQLDQDWVSIGQPDEISPEQRAALHASLRALQPWRKGPYRLFGIKIDTEWRSDWKWQRLAPHIQPLAGRRVLDIGCGNGYHCWRMAGAGAAWVLGIDPNPLFISQFYSLKKLLADPPPVHLLPLGVEDIPPDLQAFDTVFSMGVLYHRRSPIDHLLQLKQCLRPGGELVLESLVIAGEEGEYLMPRQRYAKMRNIWFIPSVPSLELWLQRAGFKQIRTVNISTTTVAEQRRTDWMSFESLSDFLDPQDSRKTIEGYPAPRRAIMLAQA